MKSKLSLYKIEPSYIRYMHSFDSRVSVKYNNRPYVGIITMINGRHYVIPLTSQTTEKRRENGKGRRSSQITTFIRDRQNREIANLLYNNMFPIKDGMFYLMNISAEKDTYESNEIRYIRKHSEEIILKAQKVYHKRMSESDEFFNKTCCDFKKLEDVSDSYQ